MRKTLIITIILAVLVVIVAAFFIFNRANQQTTITDNSSNSQSPASSVSSSLNSSGTSASTDSQQQIYCGSMPALRFSGNLSFSRDFDANAQSVWNCMTDALQNCQKAKANFGGNDYIILNKQSNLCMVSGPVVNFDTGSTSTKTCGLSEKLINLSYSATAQQYPRIKYAKGFRTMSIISAGGGSFPLSDGTTEVVSCS